MSETRKGLSAPWRSIIGGERLVGRRAVAARGVGKGNAEIAVDVAGFGLRFPQGGIGIAAQEVDPGDEIMIER